VVNSNGQPRRRADAARRLCRRPGGILTGALILLSLPSLAHAQPGPQALPDTQVVGERMEGPMPAEGMGHPEPPRAIFNPLDMSGRGLPVLNGPTSPISTSQGVITQADIRDKPLFRTTSFMEQIPGLIFANETNGIDANTMFPARLSHRSRHRLRLLC